MGEGGSAGAGGAVGEGGSAGAGGAVGEGGGDPDPRFRLANERTFLSWSRSALALIAGGLAVSQFLKVGSNAAALIVALALIAFGAVMASLGYRQWRRVEEALRRGESVPTSALPRLLTYGIAVFALAAAALAIVRVATR